MQQSRMTESHSILDQYQDRFYDFAADGDVEKMLSSLKVVPNIDLKNDKGWTALMFAARNGRTEMVKLLLERGSDPYTINDSGQTSLDIAQFWNHAGVVALLTPSTDEEDTDSTGLLPSVGSVTKPNFFCSSFLDRAAHHRKDNDWLEAKLKDRKTKLILFSGNQPVVIPLPDNSLGKKRENLRLLDVHCDDITDLLEKEHLTIFLGVQDPIPADKTEEKIPWFALSYEEIPEDRVYKIHPHATIMSPFPGLMQIKEKEAGIVAQAKSVLAWHDRYSFCPTCGSKTNMEEAGYKRTCAQEDCRSRQGVHNTSYPRVDPTVIMAVVSPDRRKILLGRGKRFPPAMWSCLAGFMEPGESIEAACRREVEEESGVKVDRVEYHSCQPWPMPSSLMIGCLGYATTTEIKVDPEELEDARWFGRQEVVQMLTSKHPKGLFCPPEQALAHQLVRAWVARTSNL